MTAELIDVDFETPANSTISSPLEIPTDPFNSYFAPWGFHYLKVSASKL